MLNIQSNKQTKTLSHSNLQFQTTVNIDTTTTLSTEPTEQTEKVQPEEVIDGTKISSLKTVIVTEEFVKQDQVSML